MKIIFLEELKNKIDKNKYISKAYENVIKKIDEMYLDDELVTVNKIQQLNITDHMKNKLILISKQKISKLIKKNILQTKLKLLIGIGDKKIDELLNSGLKTFNQLKQKRWNDKLTNNQKMMVKFNPIRKILHDDIKKIEKKIINFNKGKVILMGSYRRKRKYSKDIDVLLCGDLSLYLEYLKKQFKSVQIYSKGIKKMSILFTPNNINLYYKMDVFKANKSNYFAMLLYGTGSKQLNISMRNNAKKLGYMLNQDGIFKLSNNKKINNDCDDEKKLFQILKMEYINPENR